MTKKRRVVTKIPSLPFPSSVLTTPNRSRRFNVPPVQTMRSGVAASTRSQLTMSHLPVLSPPLKKRMTSRRHTKPMKLQLPTEHEHDAHEKENDGHITECCRDPKMTKGEETVQVVQPDPYLPKTYQCQATVLRQGGSYYNAMLTRVSSISLTTRH